jgi:argonaute-like protein implicated in RNA metabolism and viral defense
MCNLRVAFCLEGTEITAEKIDFRVKDKKHLQNSAGENIFNINSFDLQKTGG